MMRLFNKKQQQGFTLIELLVVISIIGTLAVAVLIALSVARSRARDGKRKADLGQLQKAIEIYYDANSAYPTTGSVWFSATGGCGGSYTYSGPTGYIPNLAPTYIDRLPADPLATNSICTGYVYRSDGTHYKLLSNSSGGPNGGGPETAVPSTDPLYDPVRPNSAYMVTDNKAATSGW